MSNADVVLGAMKDAGVKNARGPKIYLKNYGTYEFECQATKSVGPNGPDGKPSFNGLTLIGEIKILKSEKLVGHPEAEGVEPHPPGSVVLYQENKCLDGKKGLAARDRYKTFLSALIGAKTVEWLDSKMGAFVGPDADSKQGGAFLRGRLVVYPKVMPKDEAKGWKGKTIEAHKWANIPLSAEEQAAVDARRVAIGLPTLAAALT